MFNTKSGMEKMKSIKKNYFVFFLILLILFISSEVFLVKQNLTLKSKLKETIKIITKESEINKLNNLLLQERNFSGQILPLYSDDCFSSKLYSILTNINPQFVVLFFFSITDCGTCVYNEVNIWNKFSNNIENNYCMVCGVTDVEEYSYIKRIQRTYKIEFPLIGVKNLKDKLVKIGINLTPVIFFCNLETKKVIYSFYSMPTNKSDSGFMQNVARILDSFK